MKKTFPLGFWNYVDCGVYGKEAVKDWKDCGMSIAMSPVYDPQKHNEKIMIDILNECEKSGIKVLIDDVSLRWDSAHKYPDEYREKFIKAFERFGSHPAVFGFYAGDEPGRAEQWQDAQVAYKIQVEIAPNLTPFLNFLPYRYGIKNEIEIIQKDIDVHRNFNEGMLSYAKDSNLKMIGYDCYYQMDPQDKDELGLNLYFENLNRYTNIAKNAKIPLWVTNLAVAHFRYRCPTEDDFRWQLNTSVVSGAKGVMWFFMYMRSLRINYRLAPIDEHWERTQTFSYLSRVQRSFQYTYGDLMSRLKHKKTYHTLKAYGGYPLLEENEDLFIKSVYSEDDLPSIISIFLDEKENVYVAIVNNSQIKNSNFIVTYNKIVRKVFRIAWGGVEVDAEKNDVCNNFMVVGGEIKNGSCLAPGQMELYRIELNNEVMPNLKRKGL